MLTALKKTIKRPEKVDTLDKEVLIPLKENSGYELFLNAYMVEQGYADVMIIPPNFKYSSLFKKLYQNARENKRGLWE